MYGVLTAFVAAILTNSAVMIDWPQIDRFIEQRFIENNSSVILVNSNTTANFLRKLEGLHSNPNKSQVTLVERFRLPMGTRSTWKFNKNLADLMKARLPGRSCAEMPSSSRNKRILHFYNVQSNAAYFFELCSNPMHYEKLIGYLNTSLITLAIADAKRMMLSELDEIKKLESVLLVGFSVAHEVMRRYWLPRKFVLDAIDSFKLMYDYANSYIIGLQLRFDMLSVDSKSNDLAKFIQCAEQIEFNYTKSGGGKKVKWFITGDSSARLERIKRENNKTIMVESSKLIGVDNESASLGHTTYDEHAYFRTLLDLHLLSLSHELVVSGGSSYGMLASIMNGRLSYYVNGQSELKAGGTFKCSRMKLSEPPVNKAKTSSFK
jgi:hypothetical protein